MTFRPAWTGSIPQARCRVKIGALGPSATYVAALLVEVEGAVFDSATARVVLLPA